MITAKTIVTKNMDNGSDTGVKRNLDQMESMQQMSALQLGQAFRSKADFHEYWSICLQVSTIYIQYLPYYIGSFTFRPKVF